MPYPDDGGLILWIPILLLAGIIWIVLKVLRRFDIKTEWSAFEISWGIVLGIPIVAIGVVIVGAVGYGLGYAGIVSFPIEANKLLNGDWDVSWGSIGAALIFWFLVIGTAIDIIVYLINVVISTYNMMSGNRKNEEN